MVLANSLGAKDVTPTELGKLIFLDSTKITPL